MPVILLLWRMRQGDCKLEDNLCYIVRLCLKERKVGGARARGRRGTTFASAAALERPGKTLGSCMEM